jgi:hypothetical protein
MKKMRFCPGYDVARTCDGRCATCKHVIVRDLPPPGHLVMIQALCDCLDFPYPSPGRHGRLPVLGWGVLEEFKVIRPGKDGHS